MITTKQLKGIVLVLVQFENVHGKKKCNISKIYVNNLPVTHHGNEWKTDPGSIFINNK
jgi:hypothetical protein